MPRLVANASNIISRISGRAYLLVASIIFAGANPVTRKITDLGAQNLIQGRNPISFCNVLFVGNLCALILFVLIYPPSQNIRVLKQLSLTDWLSLIVVGILAGAIAPALIFLALSMTLVDNVVLIGRIEPSLTLALSILFLRERVNYWVISGSFISFVGVVLTVLLQEPKGSIVETGGLIHVGGGELMAAVGAVFLAISTVISKTKLRQIPLGTFITVRTVIGTVVFFFTAIKLFGPGHFMDVFSPLLWRWMLLYSAVIVVGGQLCWFRGLKISSASEVSLVSSFIPIASILAAYFVLGEQPNFGHYVGGAIVLGGIVLGQIGVVRQSAETKASQSSLTKEMDMEVGFKGV